MFLAVAGLMTFTANIASAQDEAAPAATEQVAADEPTFSPVPVRKFPSTRPSRPSSSKVAPAS